MSKVDRAWLEMDRETNLMVINGVMLFDGHVGYALLRQLFEEKMVVYFPRFRQRVVASPPGSDRYFWEDDPYFDIRSHLWHIALPEPGDTATLQNLVCDLMSTALDPSKPLWRIYLIDNFDGGSALFVRMHHCIADGIAMVQVMLSLTETERGSSLVPLVKKAKSAPSKRGLLRASMRLAASATKQTAKLSATVVRGGIEVVRNPSQAMDDVLSASLMAAASAAVLTRLVVIPSDRETVFRGELGTAKKVVWSEPVDLQQVKEIGKATGCTVNDILIAALTGALRTYMLSRGDAPDGGDLRAMVPVNLRPSDEPLALGNEFGMVYLSLPVSTDDPLRRLFAVKRRMDVLKRSPEAVVVYKVLNLLGRLPGELASFAVDHFAGKASAVLTNVPGPKETLYFDGVPIRRILFWVPQSGNIGLGISIISYDGLVTLGLVIDEKLSTDPEEILNQFHAEFDALADQVSILSDSRENEDLSECNGDEEHSHR